jgi:hypothetical protein
LGQKETDFLRLLSFHFLQIIAAAERLCFNSPGCLKETSLCSTPVDVNCVEGMAWLSA